jgi:NTP pyrophosphatase (non-canonical NTP hydrolase)
MHVDEYQKKAHETALYPRIIVLKNPDDVGKLITNGIEVVDISWVYPILGLSGEIGEVANKLKKVIRDDGFMITPEKRLQIKRELGDVDWYAAESATELKMKKSEIDSENIDALFNRKKENKIHGSGDERGHVNK